VSNVIAFVAHRSHSFVTRGAYGLVGRLVRPTKLVFYPLAAEIVIFPPREQRAWYRAQRGRT
jgi:hypothetical protein